MIREAREGRATATLRAAFSMAAADRASRRAGMWLGESVGASRVPPDAGLAIGLRDPEDVVVAAVRRGVGTVKLKIAPGRVDHVLKIRNRFPDLTIGVDANGSFDVNTVWQLEALGGLGVLYLEQPTSDMYSRTCRLARDHVGAPVFADESVRSVDDAKGLLGNSSIDGVVIKVGRLGWEGALEVRDLARESGGLWRASGLVETEIGRAFGNILAACHDAFTSDAAPASWFMEPSSGVLANEPVAIVMGGPGIGVEPDPERMARWQVAAFDFEP